eukprot:1157447-Pelagomonas_calceolata.AAC.2
MHGTCGCGGQGGPGGAAGQGAAGSQGAVCAAGGTAGVFNLDVSVSAYSVWNAARNPSTPGWGPMWPRDCPCLRCLLALTARKVGKCFDLFHKQVGRPHGWTPPA